MKSGFVFLVLSLFLSSADAQVGPPTDQVNQFLTDGFGKPLRTKKGELTEGNYMIPTQACNAKVVMPNGNTYTNIQARIDLSSNEFLFIDGKQNEMVSSVKPKEIIFENCQGKRLHFATGFPNTGTQTSETIYQVLAQGKISLVKYLHAGFVDEQRFNTASAVRVYQINSSIYVHINASLIKLQKNGANLPDIMPERKQMIREFISSNELNLKREADVIRVINYLNERTQD